MIQLITILIMIESGGATDAVGDNGRAVGCLQIHPIMVAEVNRLVGREAYGLPDRLDPVKSMEMCSIFLSSQIARYRKRMGREPTINQVLCCWNSGNILKPMPSEYLRRVHEKT